MRAILFLILFAAVALGGPVSAQTIYKWKDESGTVHYDYQPPADLAYEVLDPASGKVSFVPAPEYPSLETEDSAGADRPDAALMDPVNRARHCRELEERIRWLLAGRADMLEDVYEREEILDEQRRAELIDEISVELDRDCPSS